MGSLVVLEQPAVEPDLPATEYEVSFEFQVPHCLPLEEALADS